MNEKRVFTIPELREMGYGIGYPKTQGILESMEKTEGEVYFRKSQKSYGFQGFFLKGTTPEGEYLGMIGYFRKIKNGKRYYYHSGYRRWRRS